MFAELNYAKEFFSNYAKHSHDKLCISGLMDGQISVEFHNKKLQYIEQNQLIVFNPYQVHICKNSEIKSYGYFTFHFDTKWLEKLSLGIYFKQNIINDEALYQNFIDIVKDVIYHGKIDIENQLKDLMGDILIKYGDNKKDINSNEQNYILKTILKYILNNIDESITLDDIACEVGYSKEHIVRIFKKEFGLSPHAFLMNEKVNKVKQILQSSSNQNLSQVALDVGFYDQSHLNKFFKKSFAISPNIYKQDKIV